MGPRGILYLGGWLVTPPILFSMRAFGWRARRGKRFGEPTYWAQGAVFHLQFQSIVCQQAVRAKYWESASWGHERAFQATGRTLHPRSLFSSCCFSNCKHDQGEQSGRAHRIQCRSTEVPDVFIRTAFYQKVKPQLSLTCRSLPTQGERGQGFRPFSL